MFKKRQKTKMAFGKIPAYCTYELFMERYRSAAEFLRAHHEGKPRLSLLDVGCGEGYLKYFCDFGDIEWTGIEMTPARQEECRRIGYQKVLGMDIDGVRLPFENGAFDAVVGSHVLEHLHHPDATLREMYRVLKPGGLLIVAVPIKPPGIAQLLNVIFKWIHSSKGDTENAYSLGGFLDFLRRNLNPVEFVDVRGFRIVSARTHFDWENHEGFYRFNVGFGRALPSLCPEVNVVVRAP